MKKNIALIFFSIFFSFLLIYLSVFAWVSIVQKYKDKNNFIKLENLNFHEKYSNQMHHLRGNNWPHHKKNMLWKRLEVQFKSADLAGRFLCRKYHETSPGDHR